MTVVLVTHVWHVIFKDEKLLLSYKTFLRFSYIEAQCEAAVSDKILKRDKVSVLLDRLAVLYGEALYKI